MLRPTMLAAEKPVLRSKAGLTRRTKPASSVTAMASCAWRKNDSLSWKSLCCSSSPVRSCQQLPTPTTSPRAPRSGKQLTRIGREPPWAWS